MDANEIFQSVLSRISVLTGTPSDKLLQSTTETATDARYLLVLALARLGFTDVDIAVRVGRTRQAVSHLRTSYKRTGKWLLSNQWQTLVKWMENEYFARK